MKEFKKMWRESIEAYSGVETYSRRLSQNVKALRRNAYRFSKLVIAMQEHYHNDLLDMIHSEGVTVTQWMDAHFEIIESMNDTRERIFAAIKMGCTENEYVKEGTVIVARKRISPKTTTTKEVPEHKVNLETMNPNEKIDYMASLIESFRSKNQALRHENNQLRKDNAHMIVEMDRLKRAVKRADKTLDAVMQKVSAA